MSSLSSAVATKPPSNRYDIRWVTPAVLLQSASITGGLDLNDEDVSTTLSEALTYKLALLYGLSHGDSLQFEDCYIDGLGAGLITRTNGETLAFTFFAHSSGRIYVSSQVTPTLAAEIYPLIPPTLGPVDNGETGIFTA